MFRSQRTDSSPVPHYSGPSVCPRLTPGRDRQTRTKHVLRGRIHDVGSNSNDTTEAVGHPRLREKCRQRGKKTLEGLYVPFRRNENENGDPDLEIPEFFRDGCSRTQKSGNGPDISPLSWVKEDPEDPVVGSGVHGGRWFPPRPFCPVRLPHQTHPKGVESYIYPRTHTYRYARRRDRPSSSGRGCVRVRTLQWVRSGRVRIKTLVRTKSYGTGCDMDTGTGLRPLSGSG